MTDDQKRISTFIFKNGTKNITFRDLIPLIIKTEEKLMKIFSGFQAKPGPQGDPGKNGYDGKNGDPGPKGDRGPEGREGKQGKEGKPGNPGTEGKMGMPGLRGERGPRGENGRNGEDGNDGSPDTPQEVRDKLQSLPKAEQFSAKFIKDLPYFERQIPQIVFPSWGGGGGPRVFFFDEGVPLGQDINAVDFQGSGVTVTRVGTRIIVQIPGGATGGNTPKYDSLLNGGLTGAVDGVNTIYTLSSIPVANTIKAYINEALISPSRYTDNGDGTFTLAIPLDSGFAGLPFDVFYETTS